MPNSMFSPVKRSWQAYRYKNLVYFRHFKTASTYYLQLFDEMLHWEKICITEINWTTDHVFSYIRDPFEKRITGLAEYVCRVFQQENQDIDNSKFLELVNHPYFVKIIARTFVIDDHSLPVYNILGTNAELVDWIPIDVSGVDHAACTVKMLQYYGVNIDLSKVASIPRANVSVGLKKDFIKKLTEQPVPALAISDLDYDSILYSHVRSFFNPNNTNWPDVSWLKTHSVITDNR